MSILVAEDNQLNRRIVQIHLERAGFEVIFANDGMQALEVLEATPAVDLVITDLMMPRMDGWTLIQKLRERQEWCALPVILLSAFADLHNIERAKSLGLQSFLVKPVGAEHLLREVRTVLQAQGARLIPASAVMTEHGLDRDDYYTLIWDFHQEAEDLLSRLQQTLEQPKDDDREARLQALVQIEESCRLIGADRSRAAIQRLRVDTPDGAAALRALTRELIALRTALATRIDEIENAKVREIERERERREHATRSRPTVASTLSPAAVGLRTVHDLPKLVAQTLERMGVGPVDAILAGEPAKTLLIEFASWVPLLVPERGLWMDMMLGFDPNSAQALLEAMIGEAEASDDDRREVVRETMNMVQGSLKASLEADGVEAVVPRIPRVVRPSDFAYAPQDGDGLAQWRVRLARCVVQVAVVEHGSSPLGRLVDDLQPLDVLVEPVQSAAAGPVAEKGTAVDRAILERLLAEAPGQEIPVMEPSPFARTLASR